MILSKNVSKLRQTFVIFSHLKKKKKEFRKQKPRKIP